MTVSPPTSQKLTSFEIHSDGKPRRLITKTVSTAPTLLTHWTNFYFSENPIKVPIYVLRDCKGHIVTAKKEEKTLNQTKVRSISKHSVKTIFFAEKKSNQKVPL